MPPVVTAEDRANVRRVAPLIDLRQAFALTDPVKRQEAVKIVVDHLDSSHYTSVPYTRQVELLDEEWRFRSFCSTQLPVLVQNGVTSYQPPLSAGQNPFDYSNPLAIIERAKFFLTWRVATTRGQSGDDDDDSTARIARTTLRKCGRTLLAIIIKKIQQGETLETAPRAVERVLRYDATGEGGLIYQLDGHCNYLIEEHHLLRKKKADNVRYGRPELELLLESQQRKLFTPNGVTEAHFALQLLIQLCFVTGCRIGSFCASTPDVARSADGFMRMKDVTFVRNDTAVWTLKLDINRLKGYNRPADQRTVQPLLKSLKLPQNVYLEPHAMLLVLMIKRGVLREKGRHGKLILSVDQLLNGSTASELVGVGSEPVFRSFSSAREPSPLLATQACEQLGVLAGHCGLPYGSFHALRHDFAAQMSIMLGSDETRVLLNHDMEKNALDAYYSGGMANYDLMGLRFGEVEDETTRQRLDRSTFVDQQLSNYAHRFVAGQRSEPTPATKGSAVSHRRQTTLAARPRAAVRTPAEVEADTVARFPEYAKLSRDFDEKVKALEVCTGLTIKNTKRSFHWQSKRIKSSLPVPDTGGQRLYDDVFLLYGQMQKVKDHARKLRDKEGRKLKSLQLSGQSADAGEVLSLEAMRGAQAAITANRAEPRHDAAMMATMTSLHHATGSTSAKSQYIKPAARLAPSSSSKAMSLLTATPQDGFEPDDSSTFMQEAVFDDGHMGTEQSQEDAAEVRMKYLHFYERMWDAPGHEQKLVELLTQEGFCPFCPYTRLGSPVHGAGRKSGIFNLFRSTAQVELSVKSHLHDVHPGIIQAIRSGHRIHPGTLQSPLLPGYRQSPWFAASPALEQAYFTPLRDTDSLLDDPQMRQIVRAYMSSLPSLKESARDQERAWATSIIGKQALSLPLRDGKNATFDRAQHQMWTNDWLRWDKDRMYPILLRAHCAPPLHAVENLGIVALSDAVAREEDAAALEWPADIIMHPLRPL